MASKTPLESATADHDEKASLTLSIICDELSVIAHKLFKIGVQLGVPHHKLKEFEKEADPLSAVIDYWLSGNVEGVPVSWRSIVAALKSNHVGETGLANRISRKYCQQFNAVQDNGSSYPASESSVLASSKVTSSGCSTFELPELSPCFPYLSAEKCKMTKEEFHYYLCNLDRHTSKVKSAFARVVLDLQRDIEENSSLKVVINSLKAYDKSLVEKLLSDCASIGDVFGKILDHISFFDFEIIKILTRIGSKRIQKKYKKYKAMFKEYSKRRVVECPSDTFGVAENLDKVWILKTDRILDLLTTEELKQLCIEIQATLKSFRLLEVKKGCVQLIFSSFEDETFLITKEKQQALRNVGVLSISYGDQVVDISHYRKIIKSETSLDTNSDSGVFSRKTGTLSTTEKDSDSGIRNGRRIMGSHQSTAFSLLKEEKDLIDSRIDMLTSAKSEQSELQFFSPLCIATLQDNLQLVKQLIENGANPLDKDANGDTLLHFAALRGRLNILKYLVEDEGCNSATEGHDGGTTLHAAAASKHLHIVKYLIDECKLDPTTLFDVFKITPLIYACRSGSLDIVRYLMKNMLEYMKLEDIMNYSYFETDDDLIKDPLCCACIMGDLSIIKYLIEECHCDPSLHNKHKLSALHVAAVNGHLPVLKYFIEEKKCTPSEILHYATGQLRILKYLINELKMDKNSLCFSNLTLVNWAAANGHLPAVSFLLEIGSDDLDGDSLSPLNYAASNGHLEIVKFLMTAHTNMYSLNPDMPPLYGAVEYGHLNVVKYFIEDLQFNPHIVDSNGDSLVHVAAECGHLYLVHYLVLVVKCDLNLENNQQATPLHYACWTGHLEILKFFIKELNFDPNTPSKNYMQLKLIHLAAREGFLNIVKYLVEELQCDVNSTTGLKETPLHYAAENGHLNVVHYLFEKKAEIVCFDVGGSTPLHRAAYANKFEIVKILVSKVDSLPFIKDRFLQTPLHAALSSSNEISKTAYYLICIHFFNLFGQAKQAPH